MTIATQSRWSLLAAAALLVLGAAVFAYGYFYVDDRMLSDTAVVDRKIELGADALRNMQLISADCGRRAAPQFTRLVFVVIDAFRADFIGLRPRTSSSALHSVAKYRMPFTESLLHSGHALGVVSVAHTPTVTMPRIKGEWRVQRSLCRQSIDALERESEREKRTTSAHNAPLLETYCISSRIATRTEPPANICVLLWTAIASQFSTNEKKIFLFSHSFAFSSSLLSVLTAVALLSGTLPSFVDLIRNLNAPKFGDDNIVQRAFDAGKRMIFYGDDTWLAMFDATMFVRSNGTSSFFATDYVQVVFVARG